MTDGLAHQVSIVLDPTFGARLVALARKGPVWIVDSPDNQAATKICWKADPSASHLNGITLLTSFDTISLEDTLIDNLSTIDLHHGEHSAPTPYSVLEVIGTRKTSKIESAFAEYGFDCFEDIADGFRATREPSHADLSAEPQRSTRK